LNEIVPKGASGKFLYHNGLLLYLASFKNNQYMLRQTIFLVACLTLVTLACKSDTKEATSETTADTTMVVQPLVEVSLDTAAVAEENKKTAPAPAPAASTSKPAATTKPAASTKPAPADKSAGTAPAPAAPATSSTADAQGYVEFPSKRASYPGGEAALNKFLADNIKYPTMAREKNVQGTVYASILVDELGNIVDVSFPKPLGSGLEEEVLRVIRAMPDLIPAEDHSKPVKTKYVLPVKFKLQ